MQWQTSLPLIAILRGITPDEALAHVGCGDRRRVRHRGDPAQFTAMASRHPAVVGLRRAGADWRRNGAAGSAGRSAGAAWGAAGGDPPNVQRRRASAGPLGTG